MLIKRYAGKNGSDHDILDQEKNSHLSSFITAIKINYYMIFFFNKLVIGIKTLFLLDLVVEKGRHIL